MRKPEWYQGNCQGGCWVMAALKIQFQLNFLEYYKWGATGWKVKKNLPGKPSSFFVWKLLSCQSTVFYFTKGLKRLASQKKSSTLHFLLLFWKSLLDTESLQSVCAIRLVLYPRLKLKSVFLKLQQSLGSFYSKIWYLPQATLSSKQISVHGTGRTGDSSFHHF